MHTVDLNGEYWTVRTDSAEAPAHVRGRPFAAVVPGCVHTDLLRGGVIPDPLVGMNERETLWIGECDWTYERRFTLADRDLEPTRLDLVCEGLDTIAELHVNGTLVGAAANMHHPHRFDLRGAVQQGENRITVAFRSPLKHIRAEQERLGARPVNGDWDPYIFIRKQASSFGWDWAPKLPTSGVWQRIDIECWSKVRIAEFRALPRPLEPARLDGTWAIDVHLAFETALPAQSARYFPDLDVVISQRSYPLGLLMDQPHLTLTVEKPDLWWPAGHGHQRTTQIQAIVCERTDRSRWYSRANRVLAFRTVELNTSPDQHGTPFELRVNNKPIFCQGANWIPEGPYAAVELQTSRDPIHVLDKEDYDEDNPDPSVPTILSHTDHDKKGMRRRVMQAASLGFNMLRVWGGGIYESDTFYNACDEMGIMVWQDFMFACAMYPEEPPYPTLIEAEARHQVSRLSQHACVVLWCGANECTWAYESWGNAPGERPWKERLEGRSWGENHYLDLLPRIVKELDPTRPYWPNSPWPGRLGLGGNSADHGDRHTWDRGLDDYTTIVPRFVSEFGRQAPALRTALLSVLKPEDLKPGAPALEHHQRATGGTERQINDAIRAQFGREARTFDEWHYLAQLLQARAVHLGFAWARANRARCFGALVWQLNDCWPGMSWSLIDSKGFEKPAAGAARDALLTRQIFLLTVDGEPHLYLGNETESPWNAPIVLRRMTFEGETLASHQSRVSVPAYSSQHVGPVARLIGEPASPTREVCAVETGLRSARAFYRPDRELEYPLPKLEVDRNSLGRGVIRFTARTLMRDVVFSTELAPGVHPGRHLGTLAPVTLLPGDVFGIQPAPRPSPPEKPHLLEREHALTRPPVLWCANWFGAMNHTP